MLNKIMIVPPTSPNIIHAIDAGSPHASTTTP